MNPVENKTELKMSAKSATKIIIDETEEVEETYEEEEEQSTTASVDDELAALEREAEEDRKRMAEREAKMRMLKAKKEMDTHKTAIADKLKERYNHILIRINEKIAFYEKEKEDMEELIENLEGADETDLLDLLSSKVYFEDADNELSKITTGAPRDIFANLVADANEPTQEIPVVTAKPLKKGGKGTRTAIDRKAYPAMLLDKMVFLASGNKKGTKDKVLLSVIFNAQDKCFYRYDTKNRTKYELLQDANREWCNARGYDKLGNAWEDFKAFNIRTTATKSIAMLHQDNWIATDGAKNFIDAKWNW